MEKQEFDVNALVEELDKEFETPTEPETPEDVESEEKGDPAWDTEEEEEIEGAESEQPEEEPEEPEEGEEAPEEETPPHLDEDVHKRNEAFKKLREERDQLAASDKFLSDLASQYGMTKEQLVQKYSEEMTQKQAKEAGITPEQYKKMQELEKKVAEIEQAKNREVFNLKADQIASKYDLKEKDMMNLFSEAQRMGIDVLRNPELLEFAYKATNYEKAVEMGKQRQLEISKKRRSTSPGKQNPGANVDRSQVDEDKEIEAYLRSQHVIK